MKLKQFSGLLEDLLQSKYCAYQVTEDITHFRMPRDKDITIGDAISIIMANASLLICHDSCAAERFHLIDNIDTREYIEQALIKGHPIAIEFELPGYKIEFSIPHMAMMELSLAINALASK